MVIQAEGSLKEPTFILPHKVTQRLLSEIEDGSEYSERNAYCALQQARSIPKRFRDETIDMARAALARVNEAKVTAGTSRTLNMLQQFIDDANSTVDGDLRGGVPNAETQDIGAGMARTAPGCHDSVTASPPP